MTRCPVAGRLPEPDPSAARGACVQNLPAPQQAGDDSIQVSRTEREHKRYAHDVAVTFRVGDKAIEGRTRNVSRGGLCANVADAIAMGTDLDIDIVLVFDDGMHSEALRLPCRVAWCTTVDDGHQIGVSFRALDKQRTEYLGMFLNFLDDQRAEKRPRDQSIDDRFR